MQLNKIKTKLFFVFTIFFYFISTSAFAEDTCKSWEFPEYKWEIRMNGADWGKTDDNQWWIFKPTGSIPQIYSPKFSALSSGCNKMRVRYSVTGGGIAIARAYFRVGDNGQWEDHYDEQWVAMDGDGQTVEFDIPEAVRGKFTWILFAPFDTDSWSDRTIYINNIEIVGEVTTCSYSISDTYQDFTYKGGSHSFNVSTLSGCSWSASDNQSWISITSGSSGSGSGTVYYQVSKNSGTSRSGAITAAGKTHSIYQDPLPECTYSVSPSSKNFNYQSNTGTISVSCDSHCSWNVSSNQSWLQITSGSSGSGSGTVSYKLVENTSTSSRSGTISIENKSVTISQDGRSLDPGHLIKTDDNIPSSIPAMGGEYWIKIKNDGESYISFNSSKPYWISMSPGSGTLDAGETKTVNVTVASAEGSTARSYNIGIESSNGDVSKSINQVGISTELSVGNIKIKGDEISKVNDVYELKGDLKIGHVRGDYVAEYNPDCHRY